MKTLNLKSLHPAAFLGCLILLSALFGWSRAHAQCEVPSQVDIFAPENPTLCSKWTFQAAPGFLYQWRLNGTDIPGETHQTFLASYSDTDLYSVIISNPEGCSAVREIQGWTLMPRLISILPPEDQVLCSGQSVLLTASIASPITSYEWRKNGVAIPGATSPSYYVSIAGSYTVTVSNAEGCSQTSLPQIVTYNPSPAFPIIMPTGPIIFCSGGHILLSTQTSDGLTYQWLSSGNEIPGATQSTYPAAIGGNYTVRVTNASRCSATSTAPTTLIENLVAPGTIAGDRIICINDDPPPLLQTTAATGSGALTYQWFSSPDNITYTNIGGETGTTYDPPGLGQTTYYERKVTSVINGMNCATFSTPVVIRINSVTGGSISPDQTVCANSIPAGIMETTPSTGLGALSYQWQSSTDNFNFSNISGATAVNFSPSTISQSTYFRRVTNSNMNGVNCTALSNTIGITALVVSGGMVNGDQTLCNNDDPAAFTESLAVTGSGPISFQWQSSVDNNLYVNIIGATAFIYDPPAGIMQTTYYRRVASSTLNGSACGALSNVITVTVNGVNGGLISADQTICQNGDPAPFVQSIASSGLGTLSYQWQSSLNNSSFSNIASATGTAYDPPSGVSQSTFYRRVTTSMVSGLGCSAASNTTKATVNLVTSGNIGSDQALCGSGAPATLTQTSSSSGSGSLSYQWQNSLNNSTFNSIGGSTGTTYSPPNLSQTTYFRRLTRSALDTTSCTAASSAVVITINTVSGGSIGSNQTVCSGGNPSNLTQTAASTGSGSLSYQWQSSLNNSSFSNISGATGTNYNPPSVNQTTYFRRMTAVTGSGCTDFSNTVTVSVNSVSGGAITNNQTICPGGTPASLTQTTASSGSGTLSYQWQNSYDNSSFSNISGATSTAYNPPSGISQTTYYRRQTSSSLNGQVCTTYSNTRTITVPSLPPLYIIPSINCSYLTATLSASNGFSAYSWSNGAVGSTINVWGYPGNYTVTATLSGCSKQASYMFNNPCGPYLKAELVNDAESITQTSIFPNPANTELTIQIPDSIRTRTVHIMDQFGHLVHAYEFASSENKKIIDVSNLPDGMYIAFFGSSADVWLRKKFLIIHHNQ